MAKDKGSDISEDEVVLCTKPEDPDDGEDSHAADAADTKAAEGDNASEEVPDSGAGDGKPKSVANPRPLLEQITGSLKKPKEKKQSSDAPKLHAKIRPRDTGARVAKLTLGEYIVERRLNVPVASVKIDRSCTMGQTKHIDRVKEMKTNLLAAPPKDRPVLLCWDDQGLCRLCVFV